jgi:hypothetical protein
MNVIAHNKAYALYPRATFEERAALYTPTSHKSRDPMIPAVQKYADRGWEVLEYPTQQQERMFHPGARWVDDAHSWVMTLPPIAEVIAPQTPLTPALHDNPAAATNWFMDHAYKMSYQIFRAPFLQYDYVLSNPRILAYLCIKLQRQVQEEVTKLRSHEHLAPSARHDLRV